jgi:hypothetical protein
LGGMRFPGGSERSRGAVSEGKVSGEFPGHFNGVARPGIRSEEVWPRRQETATGIGRPRLIRAAGRRAEAGSTAGFGSGPFAHAHPDHAASAREREVFWITAACKRLARRRTRPGEGGGPGFAGNGITGHGEDGGAGRARRLAARGRHTVSAWAYRHYSLSARMSTESRFPWPLWPGRRGSMCRGAVAAQPLGVAGELSRAKTRRRLRSRELKLTRNRIDRTLDSAGKPPGPTRSAGRRWPLTQRGPGHGAGACHGPGSRPGPRRPRPARGG